MTTSAQLDAARARMWDDAGMLCDDAFCVLSPEHAGPHDPSFDEPPSEWHLRRRLLELLRLRAKELRRAEWPAPIIGTPTQASLFGDP
jgi:hypothetical protein